MLILVRHGNTFEAGQTPVWVGARTDLPLTAEGEAQARAMADYVAAHFAALDVLTAGPLLRTRRMAEIIATRVNKPFAVDDRLREIDYGLWEGLSGEEIVARHGPAALEQWEQNGVWPEGMGWAPSLPTLQAALKDFLREQHGSKKTSLAVTSNGILRLIHGLVTNNTQGQAAKVKTGHFCVLEPKETGWKLITWNNKPSR